MIIKPALLNEDGVETLLRFVQDPSLMGAEDECDGQRYLPGISVPYYPGLEEPFNLPIRGDEEPLCASIEWPRAEAHYLKSVILMGRLVAEEVTVGPPLNDISHRKKAEREALRRTLSPDPEEEAVDTSFDEFTGNFGGFFRASVRISEVIGSNLNFEVRKEGSIEFLCFESMAELDKFTQPLRDGRATLSEVIAYLRLAGNQLSLGQIQS